MNEQANQARRKDLLLPSLLPSTGWTSGDEQVALELGSCPSYIPEDSYSVQVSSQYRRILRVKAAGTLQPYQPSNLLFQVVSSSRSSSASSGVRIIKSNRAFAALNYFLRCLFCLFLKYLQDHNGIIINSIHNTPRLVLVIDTEFVTPRTNRWHRSRMREREQFSHL